MLLRTISPRALLRASLAAALLLPVPSACDSPLAVVCTNQGGCTDGLLVSLDVLPVGAYSVTVSPIPPDQLTGGLLPVFRYECDTGDGACLRRIFFAGYLADKVFVEVTTALGVVIHERSNVRYPWEYPNGKGCPGACRAGEVEVSIPD